MRKTCLFVCVSLALLCLCVGDDMLVCTVGGDQERSSPVLATARAKARGIDLLSAGIFHLQLCMCCNSHHVSVHYGGMLTWRLKGAVPLSPANGIVWTICESPNGDVQKGDWVSVMLSPWRESHDDVAICIEGKELFVQLFDGSRREKGGKQSVGGITVDVLLEGLREKLESLKSECSDEGTRER